MNLSALLGRVELLCAWHTPDTTADKLQRSQTAKAKTASVKPVPALHAVVGSPLPSSPPLQTHKWSIRFSFLVLS